jgi:hypothetical protein
MTRTIPSQKVITLQTPDAELQIHQKYYKDLDEFNEEQAQVVDCPDCYDAMIKVYDSDKIRHLCENCDLIIGTRCL